MSQGHLALAILLSGLAVSMTDWFFFGVLFHDKYLAYPEIWRQAPGGEGKAVIWSILLGFVTCGAFVLVCSAFHVRGYAAATRLARAIWDFTDGLVLLYQPILTGRPMPAWRAG